ncbi:CPBP family intramembrane metalloprotease [Clostridium botulinum]|nr:CPBP family intramembrane metalloprotease [Clostridium botulinum]
MFQLIIYMKGFEIFMKCNKITIWTSLKILILLAITALIIILFCVTIGENFKLNNLVFLAPDIGEILSVILILMYLNKKFNINIKSLLVPKYITAKLLIIMLLMFSSSYVIISLLTNTITGFMHIIQAPCEHNSDMDVASTLSLLIFFTNINIIGPIIEEIFFRGIFILKLKENCNIIIALFFSTLIFSFLHSYGYGQISAFISGLFWGLIAIKSNSIFYSSLGHITFNCLTTLLTVINSLNTNIVQLVDGKFHFNIIINMISIPIFIITFLIIFKTSFTGTIYNY